MKGGKLSSTDLHHFLSKSYDKKLNDYKDFILDKDLSGQRVQVYVNPKTKQTVVAHRGTKGFQDVVTDIKYAFGNSKSERFKHAKDIQKKAEDKYGAQNVTSIGHSLGAVAAEKSSGKDTKEIITLNKPVNHMDLLFRSVPNNQYDVRTSLDPVSILRPFQSGHVPTTLPSKSLDLLKEHQTNVLERQPILIGRGFAGRTLFCM